MKERHLAALAVREEKNCRTCRWWDVHSTAAMKGDCKVPGDHRYSRVLITNPKTGHASYALLDSFGPEVTEPRFVCGRWDDGLQRSELESAKDLKLSG